MWYGSLLKPVCELLTHSAQPHLQQIYTGFSALARAGVIELSERICPPPAGAHAWMVTVRVNGRTLVYDVADSHLISEQCLVEADAYFKRSFLPHYVCSLGTDGSKVHPLALNYEVYPSHLDLTGARRDFLVRSGIRRFGAIRKALRIERDFVPRQHLFEGAAGESGDARALFLTRAWNPMDTTCASGLSQRQREQINDMRARCIVGLRRHFGHRVLAGFAHTPFANERYRSLLVSDPRVNEKRNYLSLVARADVCVTTTGLHGSTGWKFAEYVALGKAIASEPIELKVPGDLIAGANYLAFSSADECVAMVDALLSNAARRLAMSRRNLAYYQQYLRPDNLVLNTLRTAIGPARSVPTQQEARRLTLAAG